MHHHFKSRIWIPVGLTAAIGSAFTAGQTPYFIAYNPNDAKYYADDALGGVTKILADGTSQARIAPSQADTGGYGVVLGNDGNIWAHEFSSTGPYPILMRITTGGTLTDSNGENSQSGGVPDGGGGMSTLIAGPTGDSSIYSTTGAGNFVRWDTGVFSSNHAFTWVENSPARRFTLFVGPDNLIWASDITGASQALTKYAVGGSTAPSSTAVTTANFGTVKKILAGPDGNLWFLNNLNWKVYNTSGVLQATYTFTTTTGTARDACIGPDGNMWSTMGTGATSRLIRCTPTGTLTEFPVTTDTNPWGVCAGADNNSLWYMSQTTRKFVQFT